MPRFNSTTLIAIVLFLFGESALLFLTPRTETAQLITVYLSVFVAYLVLYHEIKNIRTAAYLGVFFRGLAWLAFPTLSDDIYRLIWDGSMVLEGVNPYLYTPTQYLVENPGHPFDQLFPLLSSEDYYSVYPVVIQIVSAFGALATNDFYLSALIIKLPILVAEIATIWMLPKVLMRFKISPKYAMLYMLNPLLIVDVVGNAHFEAVFIASIVLCLKWLQSDRPLRAGMALALAVATKLLPLILFPFILKALNFEQRKRFLIGFVTLGLLASIPVLHPVFLKHFVCSVGLYFQSFEFNASVYFVVRALVSLFVDYSVVEFTGPILAGITVLICAYLFFKQKPNDLRAALTSGALAWAVYLLLATTVHPWYVAPMVVLGLLSRMKFTIIWSALVFLSYSAYSEDLEPLWFIALEYILLALVIYYPRLTKRLFSSALR